MPTGWSSGWHCGLERAMAWGTWPGETVRWREDIQGGEQPENKNRATFSSWDWLQEEKVRESGKRWDAFSDDLIINRNSIFDILSYPSLPDESFLSPSKDEDAARPQKCRRHPSSPYSSFSSSSLFPRTPQLPGDCRTARGARQPRPTILQPSAPHSNHLLRAAVVLAWGIRAITAISR